MIFLWLQVHKIYRVGGCAPRAPLFYTTDYTAERDPPFEADTQLAFKLSENHSVAYTSITRLVFSLAFGARVAWPRVFNNTLFWG